MVFGMAIESGVVEVDYHQFSIANPETDTLAVVSEGSCVCCQAQDHSNAGR
jgi:hypothetical protein